MVIHLQLLPSLFSLLFLLPIATLGQSAPYHPKDHYFINFGLSKTADDSVDPWRSDEEFLVTPPTSITNSAAMAVESTPFDTARIFRAATTYSIPVSSPGPKFIRLYLFPPSSTSYSAMDVSQSYLSLTINGLEILRNFSAYLAAANANANTHTNAPVSSGGLIREIYVTVNEKDAQKAVTLTFSPSNNGGYGFINGVEVISVPDGLYMNSSSAPYLVGQTSDYTDNFFDFSSSLAMENVIRLNVGGKTVDPTHDTGIDRTWIKDDDFIVTFKDAPSNTVYNASTSIDYNTSSTPPDTAPTLVYSTMRTMGPYVPSLKKNMTWVFEVDSGFNYSVRLHFCELDENVNKAARRAFDIYVNNQMAFNKLNVFDTAGGLNIPIYKDFVTLMDDSVGGGGGGGPAINTSSGSKLLLWVALLPNRDSYYYDALLNGLEIFKLSSPNGSLVAPNPGLPKNIMSPQINNNPSSTKPHHLFAIIGGILGVILVSLLTFIICFMIIYRRKNKAKQKFLDKMSIEDSSKIKWVSPIDESGSTATTTSVALSLPSDLCRCFSLAQIRVATCDFDEKLIIGKGGFGLVYMGTIEGENTTVAIKRLNSTSKQGTHEFQTEIEMLSRLRHVHLVSLIGYCEEHGEMILVYEYMPRGTLRDHLMYKNIEEHNDNNEKMVLSWKQRLKICLGSARGLHYLHAGAKQLIIHRDVKSTNILLDDKWTAKVSDFGLSKVGPDLGGSGATHVSTIVKGSIGYLDPEYYRRNQLTEKSDVYSFGVVLFEVLCARAAMKPRLPKEQANLAMWAQSRYKSGTLHTIVDPNITGQIAPECLRKFGEIANMCVRDHGSERPSMADVVWGLEFALQLQETAEKNNIIIGGTSEDNSNPSSFNLNRGESGISYNDLYTTSGDDFSRSSNVVDSTTNKLLDSRTSISDSSNYPLDMMSGSVFSEILDPKAR